MNKRSVVASSLLCAFAVSAAGAGASPRSLRFPSSARGHATGKTLYVADAGNSTVWLFPADVDNPSPSGSITEGVDAPVGLWIDDAGTLYVANSRGGTGVGTVTEYHAGEKSPFLTITDGIFRPVTLTVDATGTLYVGQNANGTPQIVAYAPGATKPQASVFPTKLHGVSFMGGMEVDAAGTLYAAFFVYHRPPAHVVTFSPGLKNERDLNLRGLFGIDLDPGLALDGAGNLYVGTPRQAINVYATGSKQRFRSIQAAITGGFVSDAAGNLYVTAGHFIDEYKPGSKQRFARVTSSLSIPEATAVR